MRMLAAVEIDSSGMQKGTDYLGIHDSVEMIKEPDVEINQFG